MYTQDHGDSDIFAYIVLFFVSTLIFDTIRPFIGLLDISDSFVSFL